LLYIAATSRGGSRLEEAWSAVENSCLAETKPSNANSVDEGTELKKMLM
jgi:hypothetical protein